MKIRLFAFAALILFNLKVFSQAKLIDVNTADQESIIDTITAIPAFASFIALVNQKEIQLNWKVENERDSSHYEIERSTAGADFSIIAKQNISTSPTGQGNYIFTDNLTGDTHALYYRIKQCFPDGTFYYSKTLALKLKSNNSGIIIYPNPVRDNLYLNIENDESGVATISVWNTTGAQAISEQFNLMKGNNIITLNGIERLAGGIYQIHVKLPGGKIFSQPVLKQ